MNKIVMDKIVVHHIVPSELESFTAKCLLRRLLFRSRGLERGFQTLLAQGHTLPSCSGSNPGPCLFLMSKSLKELVRFIFKLPFSMW